VRRFATSAPFGADAALSGAPSDEHPVGNPHLRVLERVIGVTAEARDVEVAINGTVDALGELPGAQAAAYYAVDRVAGVARATVCRNLPESFAGVAGHIEIATPPYHHVFVQRQPLFADDFSQVALVHARETGFRSFACVPVVADDDVVGGLACYSSSGHSWSHEDQLVLPAIGRELGAAIARMTARRELDSRRLPIQDLFDSVDELLIVSAADGRMLWANAEAERRLGYTAEDWQRMTMLDFHPPGRRIEAAAVLADILEREGGVSRVPLLAKDGSVVPVETKVRWGTWDGRRVIYIMSSAGDRPGAMGANRRFVDGALEAVTAIAHAADPETAVHARGVARLAGALARQMGLPPDRVDGLELAGGLHDVGKTTIPHEVLARPGKLSETELRLIRVHPVAGCEMVRHAESPWPLADIILQHHERLDGSGYPSGLRGPDIIPEARILAVADVLEAMSSSRPYREAFSMDRVMSEIVGGSGTRYDAEVVAAAVQLYDHAPAAQP